MQQSPLGGVGRGLANLVPLLSERCDVRLLTDDRRPPVDTDVEQHPLRGPFSARGIAWLQLSAPLWLRHFRGVFHCPFYGLPYRQPVPMVVTIHDLSFEHRADWFTRHQRLAFQLQGRHAARTARTIFTDSAFVRADVIERYRVSPDRVVVAPLAVDEQLRTVPPPAERQEVLRRNGVRSPYLVALGGAPRRNLGVAVEAWRAVRRSHPDLSLVVVGAEAVRSEPGLVCVGRIDDHSWVSLLGDAVAFCYPTAYEGFGMPALGPLPRARSSCARGWARCRKCSGRRQCGARTSTAARSLKGSPPRYAQTSRTHFAVSVANGLHRHRRGRVPPTSSPAATAKRSMAEPELAVVFVSWNSRAVLVDALASLERYPPSCSWEAIVVDNASNDGTVAAVRQLVQRPRLIENTENVGLAAANNQGIESTASRWILVSNPDVVFTEGAIDALIAVLQRHPRACFAIPRLLHPDGALQPSAGDLPTVREALLGRRGRRRTSDETSGFWWYDWPHGEERRIGHGAEACYLVRRDAVDDFGVQDPRFPLDWEGAEWSDRATRAGWEIWFCPDADVVHVGGVSIRQAQARWIVSSHRGMYRYFAPRLALPGRAALATVVTVRAAVKLMFALTGGRLYDRAHVRAGAT